MAWLATSAGDGTTPRRSHALLITAGTTVL
jgi:hypothetical protein